MVFVSYHVAKPSRGAGRVSFCTLVVGVIELTEDPDGM